MDERVARELMVQVKRLVKAQERIADALDAANEADPVAMIQRSLTGDAAATGAQGAPYDLSAPLDDETERANIRAYVAALR